MLHIVVIDASAESRQRLVDRFQGFIRAQLDQFPLLPRASIRPLSMQEIKFHAAPDVCVVGPEVMAGGLFEIARVRELFPQSSILVALSEELNSLANIEHLARLGADDVLLESVDAEDFVRKLILLGRKAPARSAGTLVVVDGAKGGVGVTSLAAALGEALVESGKSVALIDGDF